MAEMKPTSERERDFDHPVPVEGDTENGRRLDEIQLNERENTSAGRDDDHNSSKTRNDTHSSELSEVEVLPNEQLFMSRGEPSNEYDEFAEPETSASLPTDGCFVKENESNCGERCQFIGLGPGTMTKAYPEGTQIVGIRCEICFKKTPKPKPIILDD